MSILKENEKIGNYTVAQFIKKSATAESYRVTDSERNDFFLKLFDMSTFPKKLLFEGKEVYEIKLSKELKSQYVINYVGDGSFTKNGISYQYLITEFYKGNLLSEIVAPDSVLGTDDAILITLCVLEGLGHIHSLAMMHNDITPSNIILQEAEEGLIPTIIDLGHISYMVMDKPPFYLDDLSPFFRAPETFKGIYTPKSELFSVGALLYYMLFGKAPWEVEIPENADRETIKKIVKNARREKLALETEEVKIDDNLKLILKKALMKTPDKRFASAEEFSVVLQGNLSMPDEDDDTPDNDQQNIPQEQQSMAENLAKITYKKGSGNGFDNVAGRDELKEKLRKEVLFALQNPEKAQRYRIAPINGLLLYGPPGCGKSVVLESLAEESGFNYSIIKGSDFGNIYQPGVIDALQRVFDAASLKAPFVICFDEIEYIMPNLADEEGNGSMSQQSLAMVNIWNRCAKRGILVAAASNVPEMVDPAILRVGCIDKVYFVPQPDSEARKAIFKNHLKDRPCGEIDYEELAKLSDGFVAGDITEAVTEAAITAAYMDVEISQKLLVDVLRYKKPSYSVGKTIGFSR